MTTSLHGHQPLVRPRATRRWRAFGLHYLEMLLAMAVGMGVLGLTRDAFGLGVPFHDRPGVSFTLMATDMALGMMIWMRVRRHAWAVTLKMCTAMYLPLLSLPLVTVGVMGVMTFMVVAHVVMCVAMLAVLFVQQEHAS